MSCLKCNNVFIHKDGLCEDCYYFYENETAVLKQLQKMDANITQWRSQALTSKRAVGVGELIATLHADLKETINLMKGDEE